MRTSPFVKEKVNPIRVLPNMPGFSALTKGEAKHDSIEIEKTSYLSVDATDSEGEEDFSHDKGFILRSMRPPCAPESTLSKKKCRYFHWALHPESIDGDLGQYREGVDRLYGELALLEGDKDRWERGVGLARAGLADLHRAVGDGLSVVRADGLHLRQALLQELGLSEGDWDAERVAGALSGLQREVGRVVGSEESMDGSDVASALLLLQRAAGTLSEVSLEKYRVEEESAVVCRQWVRGCVEKEGDGTAASVVAGAVAGVSPHSGCREGSAEGAVLKRFPIPQPTLLEMLRNPVLNPPTMSMDTAIPSPPVSSGTNSKPSRKRKGGTTEHVTPMLATARQRTPRAPVPLLLSPFSAQEDGFVGAFPVPPEPPVSEVRGPCDPRATALSSSQLPVFLKQGEEGGEQLTRLRGAVLRSERILGALEKEKQEWEAQVTQSQASLRNAQDALEGVLLLSEQQNMQFQEDNEKLAAAREEGRHPGKSTPGKVKKSMGNTGSDVDGFNDTEGVSFSQGSIASTAADEDPSQPDASATSLPPPGKKTVAPRRVKRRSL